MNVFKLTTTAGVLLFSTLIQAQDNDHVKHNLELVQTWRATPSVIIGRCNLIDADGISARESKIATWQTDHDEIIQKIDDNFEAIIPPLLNGKNIYLNLVRPMQEKVISEIIQNNFSNKSEDQAKSFCRAYQIDASTKSLDQVKTALDTLEKWRKDNKVFLR